MSDAARMALAAIKPSRVDEVSPLVIAVFQMFTEAIKSDRKDLQFSSRDVAAWAQAYTECRKADDPVCPAELCNAFSLGKIMRKYQLELGITEIGSYGNRPIYCLAEHIPHIGAG